jgi:ATP-binding cassette, subfamily B, multidrug efflux pump
MQHGGEALTFRGALALLGDLAALMAPHKKSLAIGFAALAGVDSLQLVTPQIIERVIDSVAGGDATTASLLLYAAGVLAIAAGMAGCRFLWRYFIVGASHRIERDLRQRLYGHLQTLPPQFYDRATVGDLMAHATNDIGAVRMATGIAGLAAFDAVFLSLASIAIMLLTNPVLTLITLIPAPFLILIMRKFGTLVHRRFLVVQEAFAHLTEKANESFAGMRVIKAYGDAASEERMFAERAQESAAQNIQLARLWSFFDPLISALAMLSAALLLGAGGSMVIRGQISLGAFVAFSSYLTLLLWPMMAVGWVINILQRGTASMQRLKRILETPNELADGDAAPPAAPVLDITALTFRYPGTDIDVLKDVTFSLPAFATLGIVGPTGAGKTTLLELLCRLYDPPPGTVRLGGIDVRDLPCAALRRFFGYVPQETFLFAMSIAENIAFGADGLDRARVEALARAVALHDEIMAFPHGYDTVVGERGITLSGGQKQRVAIARALALEPAILVLDDALASVDAETEAAILACLRDETRRRTTILVSHRVSTVMHADRILVLEDGRIADAGTHAELSSREGFYAELARMQKLEDAARRTPGAGGAR